MGGIRTFVSTSCRGVIFNKELGKCTTKTTGATETQRAAAVRVRAEAAGMSNAAVVSTVAAAAEEVVVVGTIADAVVGVAAAADGGVGMAAATVVGTAGTVGSAGTMMTGAACHCRSWIRR